MEISIEIPVRRRGSSETSIEAPVEDSSRSSDEDCSGDSGEDSTDGSAP